MRNLLIAALLCAAATPALAGPAEDFTALQEDYWNAYLRDNPTAASLNGVKTYDRELERAGRAEVDRQVAASKAMLARLDAIPVAQLPAAERANYGILRDQRVHAIEGAFVGANCIP